MNAGMPAWRIGMVMRQRFPKKAIINATGRIIQGVHQLNSNTRYCGVALSWARM